MKMDHQTVAEAIGEFVRKQILYERPEIVLDENVSLMDVGAIDSISIMRITGFIEERFQISIAADDLVWENFKTLASVADLVARRSVVGQ